MVSIYSCYPNVTINSTSFHSKSVPIRILDSMVTTQISHTNKRKSSPSQEWRGSPQGSLSRYSPWNSNSRTLATYTSITTKFIVPPQLPICLIMRKLSDHTESWPRPYLGPYETRFPMAASSASFSHGSHGSWPWKERPSSLLRNIGFPQLKNNLAHILPFWGEN